MQTLNRKTEEFYLKSETVPLNHISTNSVLKQIYTYISYTLLYNIYPKSSVTRQIILFTDTFSTNKSDIHHTAIPILDKITLSYNLGKKERNSSPFKRKHPPQREITQRSLAEGLLLLEKIIKRKKDKIRQRAAQCGAEGPIRLS